MDTARAFSQLTLVGDKSGMLNVDFLVQPFVPIHGDSGGGSQQQQLVIPSGATLAESWIQFHAVVIIIVVVIIIIIITIIIIILSLFSLTTVQSGVYGRIL